VSKKAIKFTFSDIKIVDATNRPLTSAEVGDMIGATVKVGKKRVGLLNIEWDVECFCCSGSWINCVDEYMDEMCDAYEAFLRKKHPALLLALVPTYEQIQP
jgi:hypothetical protein